jgi:hypothetical protein
VGQVGAASKVNMELGRFSDANLQVVGEQGIVKSKFENGPETVRKRSNSAVTLLKKR